jgi:hypothetical protein
VATQWLGEYDSNVIEAMQKHGKASCLNTEENFLSEDHSPLRRYIDEEQFGDQLDSPIQGEIEEERKTENFDIIDIENFQGEGTILRNLDLEGEDFYDVDLGFPDPYHILNEDAGHYLEQQNSHSDNDEYEEDFERI